MSAENDRIARLEGAAESWQPPRWWLFHGIGEPAEGLASWPIAPPGRRFPGPVVDVDPPPPDDGQGSHQARLTAALLGPGEISAVNVGLALRRPLLVTGSSEAGRAGLAHLIAHELRLGRVLRWAVNGRTILHDGITADGTVEIRPQDSAAAPLGRHGVDPAVEQGAARRHLCLGPLATALLPRSRPRVLLVDGLDRGDYDLPDDLVEIIERGRVVVPELRGQPPEAGPLVVAADDPGVGVTLDSAVIQCAEFPVIVLVSDGDREFPLRLRRRCVSIRLPEPSHDELLALARARYGDDLAVTEVVRRFAALRDAGAGLTVDELLDAAHLAAAGALEDATEADRVLDATWNALPEDASQRFAGRSL